MHLYRVVTFVSPQRMTDIYRVACIAQFYRVIRKMERIFKLLNPDFSSDISLDDNFFLMGTENEIVSLRFRIDDPAQLERFEYVSEFKSVLDRDFVRCKITEHRLPLDLIAERDHGFKYYIALRLSILAVRAEISEDTREEWSRGHKTLYVSLPSNKPLTKKDFAWVQRFVSERIHSSAILKHHSELHGTEERHAYSMELTLL